ncbi:hypothetical protein [Jiulongibacter sp. NS-SX5]|uniref:hypothetical protein n=1 Tax=Jiulongibacter sp. NS-SX5 TaxID=3463854 RepID=UPI0040599BFC
MKKIYIHMVFIALLFTELSCANKEGQLLWLNESERVVFQNFQMLFISSIPEIKDVRLYTTAKPFYLNYTLQHDTLTISKPEAEGIIEGPAVLTINTEDQTHYFEFYLTNNKQFAQLIDYRSPKTVNPDSILEHQQIIHRIDEFRNIQNLNDGKLFFEQMLGVTEKVGAYYATENKPISCYYLQAGSAEEIPISVKKSTNGSAINIGPLKDKIGNPVSDGTNVNIQYTANQIRFKRSSVVLDGEVRFTLPPEIRISDVTAEIAGLESIEVL